MRVLFTLTLFLGSFLLFLVEPMVAKMILPTFGGSAQVWNTSLVFFQGVLLLGYLYAHVSSKRLGTRRGPTIHLILMVLALLLLPISAKTGYFQLIQDKVAASQSSFTAFWVLVALAGLVGVPFFVVSSGAPLLQRWFAHTDDPAAKDPYFLYSASNVGSMLGLFAYPFVLEPTKTLSEQGTLWQIGFVILAILMALCAVVTIRVPSVKEAEPETKTDAQPITTSLRLKWLILSAIPSSLLLAVTTYLTTNVAPIPLLWVVPLALYLLSFIFAFARWGTRPLPILQRLLPLIATPLALAILMESAQPIVPLAIFHLSVFLVTSWLCHARLVESRPATQHLTEFYLYLSLGGVVGGAFNALLAPVAFNGLYEYPIALMLATLMRGGVRTEKSSKWDLIYPVIVALIAVAIFEGANQMNMQVSEVRSAVVLGVPLILCFFAVDHVRRFAATYGAVFLISYSFHTVNPGVTVSLQKRSFFGVHRVVSNVRWFKLLHGNTIHGMQDRKNPTTPLTYYYPTGPIGLVMKTYGDRLHNVALVGLGVGSLAAYGRQGQNYTFYEIDPMVQYIARDSGYFSFIKDSKAKVGIVLGDARLTLAKSQEKYDLIVLDAFSSDSIPVHLLTKEAIQMYVSKLTPNGFLAFHISNRYLDLADVLTATGKSVGLGALTDDDAPIFDEGDKGKTMSRWLVLSRTESDVSDLIATRDWSAYDMNDPTRPWTDDFSNVLSAVRLDQ